jgi:hypothetical protein
VKPIVDGVIAARQTRQKGAIKAGRWVYWMKSAAAVRQCSMSRRIIHGDAEMILMNPSP